MTRGEDPAERGGYLRFFYRNWRPTRLGGLGSRAFAWAAGLGLLPEALRHVTGLRHMKAVTIWFRYSAMLTHIPPGKRAPILKAWCQVATSGRCHLPVSNDAPVSAFAAIAPDYPVFRIDYINQASKDAVELGSEGSR